MKIEYVEPIRKDRFGLGWARRVLVNGVVFDVSTRPGKRVRLAYSKKYGYHWHCSVVRDGKIVISGMPCDKNSSVKAIIEEALAREFNVLAFGKAYWDVVGMIYESARRSNFRFAPGDVWDRWRKFNMDSR